MSYDTHGGRLVGRELTANRKLLLFLYLWRLSSAYLVRVSAPNELVGLDGQGQHVVSTTRNFARARRPSLCLSLVDQAIAVSAHLSNSQRNSTLNLFGKGAFRSPGSTQRESPRLWTRQIVKVDH
jgi:hypothetical protein